MELFCYVTMIVVAITNASLLSIVYPISLFTYALLDNPRPKKAFWTALIIYTFILILVKFAYQMPFICGTPPFSIFDSFDNFCSTGVPINVYTRWDYVLGIHNYNGASSYPENQGILDSLSPDFCLLALLIL